MRHTILIALLAFLLAGGLARADPVDDALARFALDKFEETERAIADLTRSAHPTAGAILEALGGNRLLVRAADRALLFRDPAGPLRDAKSGEPADAGPRPLKPIRTNNRVRRALDAAVGALTLLSSDPARRREAAEAVYRSRDSAALDALDTALSKEPDAGVRALMAQARAAVLLLKSDATETERLAAVPLIARRGAQDAIALLRSVQPDAPPALRDAASAAARSIEARLATLKVVQDVVYGLSLGSVLLLAAIGLAVTFGVMGVINMAHGEMVMLGAYTTFIVQETIRAQAPGLFDASLLIALPLAFLVTGLVGVAIERGLIRHLYGRPLETLLATWGLSLILQQAVRSAFGPSNREVGTPGWMSGAIDLGGLTLTTNRICIIVFALALFLGLLLLLRATRFGVYLRAVTQNRRMAASLGIRTPRVDALTFGLGSGIAGLAGVALSQIDNVSPNLGQSYIIDSFTVVVFGGVGNLWGTLVGAMTLGVANKLLEPYAGAVLAKILILVAIILFIQKRPRGLFALKGRAVEA